MIDIQKLADLARLKISKEEQEGFQQDLENIVTFVDIVQSRDVADVPTVSGRLNVFREDLVAPLGSAYDLVLAAPSHQDGFVKVPKIIGE